MPTPTDRCLTILSFAEFRDQFTNTPILQVPELVRFLDFATMFVESWHFPEFLAKAK
jgi:hypothetical protein